MLSLCLVTQLYRLQYCVMIEADVMYLILVALTFLSFLLLRCCHCFSIDHGVTDFICEFYI